MGRPALWRSIAQTLSGEIAEGLYRPGEKLPTEAELSTRFGVNRHTLRQALAQLATDGLVWARQGSGVFVAAKPTDYPLGRRTRFHQNITASGRAASRRYTRLETRLASADEAELLRLAPEARVHVVEGISLVDEQPVAVFRSVFPAERLPDLLSAVGEQSSITAALAQCGVSDYTRASTRITAKLAHGTLALQLEVQDGAPILRSEAINIDAHSVPIEYGRSWFAGDRITLTLNPDGEP